MKMTTDGQTLLRLYLSAKWLLTKRPRPPLGQAPGAVLQHFIFFLTLAQKAKSVSPRQTFPAYFNDCG